MSPKKRFALLILFIIISIAIAIFSGYFGFNPVSIEKFVSVNHIPAVLLYNLLFIVLASFSFSVSVMTSLGTLLFSWYEVVLYAMIGIICSSIVHFYISKRLGRDYIRNYLEKNHGKIEKFDEIVEENTFKTIFILSAIFFVPPSLPNLLGGIIKIKFKNYIFATFLGNLPNTLFTVYLINGLMYSNNFQIYFSIAGLIATTVIALYFYKSEIEEILKLSFPSLSRIFFNNINGF